MNIRPFAAVAAFVATSGMVIGPAYSQAAQPVESAPAADATETRPPEASQIPLVVRIDKTALYPYTNSTRNEKRPVDRYVLGARAIGDSETIGESRAVLLPNSDQATFDVRFQGRTTTTTAAYQSPAVVYSRTFTDFDCTSHIAFDPRVGFKVVGETEITSDTKLAIDGAGATSRFGRRLISRIAMRKAQQLHEAGRQIADRDNRRDVRDGFEKEVERLVADANRGMNLNQYVERFLGKDSSLQLFAKSSADCIHIGIGSAGERYAAMTELPPRSEPGAPVEIWVHSSLVGKPVTALLTAATPAVALPLNLQDQVLNALSLGESSDQAKQALKIADADDSINVSLHDGWLVLGLPQNPEQQSAANVAQTAGPVQK